MTYKPLDPINDITSEKSQIFEVIPISGSLLSGTTPLDNWQQYPNQIKSGSVSGSFFNTVYDSIISPSASALLDITYGFSVSSSYYSTIANVFIREEKHRMYQQFAELLLGDKDGIFTWNGDQQNELFFLSFKRSVFKDAVRKGFTRISLHYNEGPGAADNNTLTDVGAGSYYFRGPGGEYMYLTSSNSDSSCTPGCVWYDAAAVALSPTGAVNIFADAGYSGSGGSVNGSYRECIVSGTIDKIVEMLGGWFDCGGSGEPNVISLHNTTNIFSRIYFLKADHHEFNYSSNPTAIDSEGRIRVTSGSLGTRSRVYITGAGLYDVNNTLLGVAKLSDPIKKDSSSMVVIRARLLY